MGAWINALSDGVAKFEMFIVTLLAGLIPTFIIANVVSREIKTPIYWVDEASILAMVWLALVGTSVSIKKRESLSVEVLAEIVRSRYVAKAALMISDVATVLFGIILFALCFNWFDPVLLYEVGFDTSKFSGVNFNFIYEEQAQTMPLEKFWFWLILPIIGATVTLHGTANLIEGFRKSEFEMVSMNGNAPGPAPEQENAQ